MEMVLRKSGALFGVVEHFSSHDNVRATDSIAEDLDNGGSAK